MIQVIKGMIFVILRIRDRILLILVRIFCDSSRFGSDLDDIVDFWVGCFGFGLFRGGIFVIWVIC